MSEEYLGLIANDDNSGAAIQTLKLDNEGGTLTVTMGTSLPFLASRKDMGIAKATFGDITYIVCAGGIDENGDLSAQIDVFKVQDGVVTNIPTGLSLGMARSGVGGIAFPAVPVPGEEALQVVLFVGGLEETGPVDIVELFTINAAGVLDTGTGFLNLSVARSNVTMATMEVDGSPIAICAGGVTEDGPSAVIDTFGVGHSAAAELSVARSNIGIATVEIEGAHYVVCVGGKSGENTVNAIDVFSVSSTGELTLIEDQANLANTLDGVSVIPVQEKGTQYILCVGGEKDRAPASPIILFAGGYTGGYSAEVDVYLVSADGVTTTSSPHGLEPGRSALAAAVAGNIILFAGGYNGSVYSAAVDAYLVSEDGNSVATTTSPGVLQPGRSALAAAVAGNIILFAGGYTTGSVYSAAVDAYLVSEDGNSVERLGTLDGLSPGRRYLAGASAGNIILFAGGNTSSSVHSAAVDAYLVSEDGNSVSKITTAITGLSPARRELAAAAAGNIILFAGGYTGSVYTAAVDAYLVSEDGNSVEKTTSPGVLQPGRRELAGAAAGNIILFAGGTASSAYSAAVDAYLVSEDGNSVEKLGEDYQPQALSLPRSSLAAAVAGNIILFGGGYTSSYKDQVNGYKVSEGGSVTEIDLWGQDLIPGRYGLAGAAAGNIILFAGGYASGSVYSAAVDAYLVSEDGNSVGRTDSPGALQPGRERLAAAAAGNIILFAGGNTSSSVYSAAVDAYKVSGDTVERALMQPDPLIQARAYLAAASAGNIILFAGGNTSSSVYSAAVDAYLVSEDGNSVSKITTAITGLSPARRELAAAAAGNIILFAGGYSSGSPYYSDVVDAYKVSEDGNSVEKTTSPQVLQLPRTSLAGASAGNIILFAGGYSSGSPYYSAAVDAYKVSNGGNSVEKIATPGPLSVARRYISAASFVGADDYGYIVFSGGTSATETYSTAVDVYKVNRTTDEVTKVNNDDVPQLLVGFYSGAGAGVNGVALFGGGYIYLYSNLVDVYRVEEDDTVTKLPTMTLSQGRQYLAAAGATPAAIREFTDRIEVFKMHANGALTAVTDEHTLLEEKGHVGSTMVSMGARDYLVCAGGVTKTGPSDKVEVFEVDIRVT